MIRKRIKEICSKQNLLLSDLAKAMNISAPNLSYIINRKEINSCTLQKIADILNVPISDLLSEVPLPEYNKADVLLSNRKYSPYQLQIGRICKIKGITQHELASRLNITYQTLHSLTRNPNIQSLERIAKALDVPLYCLFVVEEEDVIIPIRFQNKETEKVITSEINIKLEFK